MAGYIRSSPKKAKEGQESIEQQQAAITAAGYTRVRWYIDRNIKGDSDERPALTKLWRDWDDWKFNAIVVYHPDRLARGWLGLKWLHEEILPRHIRLIFLNGCPNPQDENGELNLTNYLFLGLTFLMGYYDLMNIRRNTKRGIDKAKAEGRYRGRVSAEDKARAIKSVLGGRAAALVAQSLGVRTETVNRWAKQTDFVKRAIK